MISKLCAANSACPSPPLPDGRSAAWSPRYGPSGTPLCPAAVSIEGTPPPSRPDQCTGIDLAQAQADLQRLHAAFSAMRDSMAEPLTPSGLQAALDQQRAMWRQHGASEDLAVEGFRRNLTTRDGHTWMRPLPPVLAALQTTMADLDIIAAYRRVQCPLLVVLAADDLPEQQPFHELYAAYRRGFEGRLAEVSGANPRLRVTRVKGATHAIAAERPDEIARLISDFAASSIAR